MIYIIKNESGQEVAVFTNYEAAVERWDELSNEAPHDLVVEE